MDLFPMQIIHIFSHIHPCLHPCPSCEGPTVAEFPPGSRMQVVGERVANFCNHAEETIDEAGAASTELLFGLPALQARIALAQDQIDKATLTELTPLTECCIYRWLLGDEEKAKLDKMASEGYTMVLTGIAAKKTEEAKPKGSVAMEHMVAAHTSKEAEKVAKKRAVSSTIASAKGKKKAVKTKKAA